MFKIKNNLNFKNDFLSNLLKLYSFESFTMLKRTMLNTNAIKLTKVSYI